MTALPHFEERFEALAALAYRVAFRILGDRDDAEEIAQEALARALVHWKRIGGHDEAWVARVATNLSISRWRRRRPAEPFVDAHAQVAAGDPAVLERIGLVAALKELPRRQREVLVLRYLADLPEAAVAEALGTSVGSVKQHAHRATTRLRAELVTRGAS